MRSNWPVGRFRRRRCRYSAWFGTSSRSLLERALMVMLVPKTVRPTTTLKTYIGKFTKPPPPEGFDARFGNPALGRSMGQAGRRRVEERFSWASVAERTEQVYADAIAEFKRSSGD